VRLNDTRTGYGWISIALHWVTAAIVLTMWAIGTLAQGASPNVHIWMNHLHTSIGMAAYVLLWARVLWRFKVGHPGPLPTQRRMFFVGKFFHYLLLWAIAAMLVTGPLMVWAAGEPIHVFDVAIPSPMRLTPGLHDPLRQAHAYVGLFVFVAVVLHIAATLKHVMKDRDGTFEKILIADRAATDGQPGQKLV
jgi:cytochrome b561